MIADQLGSLSAVLISLGALSITDAVKHAVGPVGLGVIFVYSFLIAVILPFPGEIVLLAPIDLGLPNWLTIAFIIGISSLGKALGSIVALQIGDRATTSGPVLGALDRLGIDVVSISQRTAVEVAQKYGYLGLAVVLSIPGFPDTLSIYAFTVIEKDNLKFAIATFIGSAGRLVIWIAGAKIVYLVF
ncbi:YqaA family protein [Halocatena halophila]|uniref:YqaA family protein n=1 Tax=Halocatena halophila TaxID=2814576 RepID=UPI002ED3F09F